MKRVLISIIMFLTLHETHAQDSLAHKKIDVSGSLFKTYSVNGKKIQSAKELETILRSLGDDQVNSSFSSAKAWNLPGQIFAAIGGGLCGYYLGSSLGGKKVDKSLLLYGAGSLGIGVICAIKAESHAKTAVDRYNAAVTKETSLRLLLDPRSGSLVATLNFKR